jgi:hypothetical protein
MNKDNTLSRGERNNNPLNIRLVNGTTWKGQRILQTDKDFVQFETITFGIRAAFKILAKYIEVYHLKTVEEIVRRWAPASENDTAAYVRSVLQWSHLGGKERISSTNAEQMERLVYAMARVETGKVLDAAVIHNGWCFYQCVKAGDLIGR